MSHKEDDWSLEGKEHKVVLRNNITFIGYPKTAILTLKQKLIEDINNSQMFGYKDRMRALIYKRFKGVGE